MKKIFLLLLLASPAMANISFIGSENGQSAYGGAASVSISTPSGLSAGDLLIINFSTNLNDASPGLPSGWLTAFPLTSNDIAGDAYLGVYYKIATQSEPSSYIFTATSSAGLSVGLSVLRGVDPAIPIDVVSVSSGGETDYVAFDLPTGLGITTKHNNDYILIFANNQVNGGSAIYSSPSGFMLSVDHIGNAGSMGESTSFENFPFAGPTGNIIYPLTPASSASSNWTSVMIGIKPITGTLLIQGGQLKINGGKLVVQ